MSLALWPIAKITASVSILVFGQITAFIFPFSISKSVALVLNKTCPPFEIIYSLIFLTIFLKLSVPIWGFAVYKISFGAPNLTNSSNTFLEYILAELPVFSFPSENVPAPPSPNWIFDTVENFLLLAKSSTSFSSF